MKLDDLVNEVAEATGSTKTEVKRVIDGLGVVVGRALARSDEVTLPGICKISSNLRPGRTGKNPRTGEALEIPAKHVPKLSALKALKYAAAKEL